MTQAYLIYIQTAHFYCWLAETDRATDDTFVKRAVKFRRASRNLHVQLRQSEPSKDRALLRLLELGANELDEWFGAL